MDNDKSLFAAYLNMARNNCYMVLSHIDEKIFRERAINEDAMQHCELITILKEDKKREESLRACEMIGWHYPFMKILVKSESDSLPSDYADILSAFIKQLNELRNYHTHYLHQPYVLEDKIMGQLQFLFDVSRREVRKRFSLQEQDVKHLVRKTVKTIDGKKTVVEKENFHYAFENKEGRFTDKGIAFFISLFLEKKYTYLLLRKIRGFKSNIDKQKKATLEAFCIYHIRVPQPKLQSNNTKEGLLLDILEELKRCPAELYEHLSENDKARFKFTEDAGAAVDEEQPEIVLKRYGDRFPYLALRYLELTESLKGLHFHIDLGKYYFKVYEKSVDSEIRIRRLHKNMKGFGRLNDFEDEKMPENWQLLVKRTDELSKDYAEPYIVKTTPHFHIVNNQIGIWLDYDMDPKNYSHKPPSLIPPIGNPETRMWLSLYELPVLVFYHLIIKNDKKLKKKGGPKSISDILSGHIGAIHQLFEYVETSRLLPGFNRTTLDEELKGRNLEYGHIPKPILEYLLEQKPAKSVFVKAGDKLKKLKDETNYLLKKLELDLDRAEEKVGSKRYKAIQTGKMGDFLARDMLFFQPAVNQNKGKATSTLFQVLQARLAFYGRDKYLLESLYKECNLIQSNNPHPFLHGLAITNSLVDYYRNYLIKRNDYLDRCIKKCAQGKIGSQDFHFLHLGEREKRDGSPYYKQLAGKFLKAPLNLPRGLFMKQLIKYFETADNTVMQKIINNTPRVNTNFLIIQYIINELNDSTQAFYDWQRSYKVFNQYYDTRQPNRNGRLEGVLNEKYFNTAELTEESEKVKRSIEKKEKPDPETALKIKNNHNFYTDNEKQLRQVKACDAMLFLMARDLFPSLEYSIFKGLDINQLKLSDILPDTEKGILSQTIELSLPLHGKKIVQRGLKLKNYGDFRRFLKDRRLESLLPYFEEENIDRTILEKELENYDASRIEIHKLILIFEKEVITKYGIDYETAESPCVNHESVLDRYFQDGVDNNRRGLMENIRNKFSHNQYPDNDKFKDMITNDNQDLSIAGKFVELARTYYQIETNV